MNRGSDGGTFTRANRATPVLGSRTPTARFSDRFEMYGNGCDGSTDSGVRIGAKRSSIGLAEVEPRGLVELLPVRHADAGVREPGAQGLRDHTWCWRAIRVRTRSLMRSSCSAGGMPSGEVEGSPARDLLLQPGHPDLEELVEVVLEDREELHALEQRQVGVLGQRQDAGVELEPGQLSVVEALVRGEPPRRGRRRRADWLRSSGKGPSCRERIVPPATAGRRRALLRYPERRRAA